MNEIKAKALRAVQLMNLHERQEIAHNPAAATKKAEQLLAFGAFEGCTSEQFAVALQAAAADSFDLKPVQAPRTPDANPATAAPFGGSLSSPPQMKKYAQMAIGAVRLLSIAERQEIAESRKAALSKAEQLLRWNDNSPPGADAVEAFADELQHQAEKAMGAQLPASFTEQLLNLAKSPAPSLQPLAPPPPPPPPSIQVELSGLHQDLLKLDDALNSLVTDLDPILRPPVPSPMADKERPVPPFVGSSLLASVLDGRRHAQKLLADVQALRDQINL